MSNAMAPTAFPSSANEALAMLYLQSQDLTGKTPEEIVRLYTDTLIKVKKERAVIRNEHF